MFVPFRVVSAQSDKHHRLLTSLLQPLHYFKTRSMILIVQLARDQHEMRFSVGETEPRSE